ncbi:hypothetical protein ACHHYP_20521 [Achlya hypogyna]|uniref:Peptidase C1A papain C-terminal domain-containing protein n=1 Tax=Achlya hypogyna TaxID=1202772 RepID=A0A1V9YJW4_ACHHY|nr:hypothetical protein ACHHYP_20521 [Achlya hypogyna]
MGEKQIERAIARQPIALFLNSSSEAFQYYKGGILSGECVRWMDHVVTGVGYGVDELPYFKIKNSWAAAFALPTSEWL